jgi:hypothetical protein
MDFQKQKSHIVAKVLYFLPTYDLSIIDDGKTSKLCEHCENEPKYVQINPKRARSGAKVG